MCKRINFRLKKKKKSNTNWKCFNSRMSRKIQEKYKIDNWKKAAVYATLVTLGIKIIILAIQLLEEIIKLQNWW